MSMIHKKRLLKAALTFLLFLMVTRETSVTGFIPSFCIAFRLFFSPRLCLLLPGVPSSENMQAIESYHDVKDLTQGSRWTAKSLCFPPSSRSGTSSSSLSSDSSSSTSYKYRHKLRRRMWGRRCCVPTSTSLFLSSSVVIS